MSDENVFQQMAEGLGADDLPPPPDLPPSEPEDPRAPEAAAFPLNDIGNGRRFVLYFGEDVLWVPRVGWFTWEGRFWRKDDDELEVRRKAQCVSELMEAEIPHVPIPPADQEAIATEQAVRRELSQLQAHDEPSAEQVARIQRLESTLDEISAAKARRARRRRDHASFAKATGNTSKIVNMLAEGGVSLAQSHDTLDAAPLTINTQTGPMRFKVTRGEGMSPVAEMRIDQHRRTDWLTKMVPVAYDPSATAPLFDAFLERIQPIPEMRRFIQRWFGLSATALTIQRIAFFYGHGANGKSVLVDLMARLLDGYAATAKIESLTGTNRRSGGDATPDLIPLMGARMVRASEPEEGTRLQEGMIKELTGGEPILVRALQKDFVEVKPHFKLTISGNHKPDIRGTDDGIWRRVMLVPFDVQIPEEERDPDLIDKLWEERSGILNWIVEGLIDYLEGGLQVPDLVADATKQYREDSDPMQSFLDKCCEATGDPADFTRTKELVAAFNFWLSENGGSPFRERTVQMRLADKAGRWRDPRTGRSFTAQKRSVSGYVGLRFTDMFRKSLDEGGALEGRSERRSSSPDPF